MYCLEHMNENELSRLCTLSNTSIGCSILLRAKIDSHFNKISTIDSVNNYCKQLSQQQKDVPNKPKNVKEILKSSPKGGILLSIGKLNDSSRNLVVENIINYYLDNEIVLNNEIYTKIASEILKIYPKESKVSFSFSICSRIN